MKTVECRTMHKERGKSYGAARVMVRSRSGPPKKMERRKLEWEKKMWSLGRTSGNGARKAQSN
jgi:hypothetical protein